MKAVKTHPWYSFNKVLSFNALLTFVLGGRGLGKTYGAKKLVIKKFLKYGEQFILLRRYEVELATRGTFFSDLIAKNEFPDYDFRVFGFTAQVAHKNTRNDKKRVWRTMGYFAALNTSQNLKGASYAQVTTIIYDEFIIEKGRGVYLKDEVTALLNFMSTVDRYQDRARVILLANSVSIMNPYFLYYKIRPDEVGEFSQIKADDGSNDAVFHFADNKDFNESVYKTRFGRMIQGTAYADYAVEGNFSDNHRLLIDTKTADAKYLFTLQTGEGTFSVWQDPYTGVFYLQSKLPKGEKIYTTEMSLMGEGKTYVSRSHNIMGYLTRAFNNDKMRFDEQSTRNNFIEIGKR